ncbi:MAG: alpha/beta fold hydrolase [Acidimicrobiales bacterium]
MVDARAFLRRVGLVSVLVIGIAAPPVGPSLASPAPRAADPLLTSGLLGPCRGEAGALCGHVVVPWYWGQPGGGGGRFTIRFAVFPHTDRSIPPLEPIVAMEGGPGYPSIGSAGSYLFLIGSLHRRHDLILMDQRGTGASDPIDCAGLQNYDALSRPGDYPAVTAACARSLGRRADAYGSAAVGDDLAAVLAHLHVARIDLYGDSYGSYAAQVFTVHHPGLVRTLVLDSTYNEQFDPLEPEAAAALRRAWDTMCAHLRGCRGDDLLRSIAAFASALAVHPITGTARDGYGDLQHIDLTAPAFAQLVFDATYDYVFFRDLPAAIVAARHGDLVPIERLAADDVGFNSAGGAPSGYSAGDLQAVSCHDYPTAWNVDAGFGQRAAELDAAIAALPSATFYPFSKSVWLDSLDENELVYGCLDWPAPRAPAAPPFPPGEVFPHTPVLVLDGLLDQATPLGDASKVARTWPDSTFVPVANSNHVTAEDDFLRCVSVIVRRFIASTTAGNTACARSIPPVYVTPTFPTALVRAPQAGRRGPVDRSTRLDRQAGWVAGATIGEAFEQWYNVGLPGYGLHGGTFHATGAAQAYGPLVISFTAVRFVPDMSLSGTATWDRASARVQAAVTLRTRDGLTGRLRLSWSTDRAGAVATEVGTLGGHPVSLAMDAPFSPQG